MSNQHIAYVIISFLKSISCDSYGSFLRRYLIRTTYHLFKYFDEWFHNYFFFYPKTNVSKSVSWPNPSSYHGHADSSFPWKKSIFFQFGRFVAFNIVCWNKQTNDMAKRNNNSNNLFDKCVITEQIKTKTKPSNFMSLDFSLFVHHLSFFSCIISFSLSACTTFNALVSNRERVNEKRIKQNKKRTTFSSAPKT